MSKERARRRAAAEAAAATQRADRSTAHARSRRRQAHAQGRSVRRRQLRALIPGSGRYSRRTRTQRAMVVVALLAALIVIWFVVDDWGVRIALSLVAAFATPALVTLALDRSNR